MRSPRWARVSGAAAAFIVTLIPGTLAAQQLLIIPSGAVVLTKDANTTRPPGRARQSGPLTHIPLAREGPLPNPLDVEGAVRFGLQNNPQIAAGIAGVASAAANYRGLAAPNTIDLGTTRVQGTSTAPSLTGATSDTIVDVGT